MFAPVSPAAPPQPYGVLLACAGIGLVSANWAGPAVLALLPPAFILERRPAGATLPRAAPRSAAEPGPGGGVLGEQGYRGERRVTGGGVHRLQDGGDGSLAVVAAVAAAHGIPFVCVPAGTHNHFALDLGVDRHDVIGALDAFTDGVERQIDMAEVNGRAFLNNASLGIYGDAVRSPAYRDAKVRTLLATAAEVMGPSAEAPALYLVDDLGREHRDLAVVLVSNNPYALDRPLARGTRPTPGGGQLGIVVVDAPGDSPRPPGRAWSAPRLEVSAPEPVNAGVDGEAVELSPPLWFAIRPAALRVRISSRHPGASPSASYVSM